MKVASNIEISEKELSELGINVAQLTDDLTLPNPEYANIVRFGRGRFYRKVSPYITYLYKVKDNYIIPRYYIGEERWSGIQVNPGRSLSFDSYSNVELRDYQKEFFDKYDSIINNNTGILIESPCGHGKTIMAIHLSYIRNVQTLIIVPTYYLARQWVQRIEEVTTGTCHIIKSTDTYIPTDKDFTIIVTDLFNCRVLPKEFVENIGHVILDEAHRMGAETYMPILNEIPAKYRTALTATFRRTDGVHKILKYHFGTILHMDNQFPRPLIYGIGTEVRIRGIVSKNKPYEEFLDFLENNYHGGVSETKGAIEYDSKSNTALELKAESAMKSGFLNKTQYRQIMSCLRRGEEMSYPTVESYLNDNSRRRKLAIKLIQKSLDAGRTILFLSKRKDTLRSLYNYFADYKPMLIISETNVRTDAEEEYLQKECRLILGVNQLAKEGLDIDRLDTLIIHLPMADTEQAVGRISRLCKGKKQPIAFYLVDSCPLTFATFSKAKKTFAINGDFKGTISMLKLPAVLA